MSDFLVRVAERALGTAPVIEPVLASAYELSPPLQTEEHVTASARVEAPAPETGAKAESSDEGALPSGSEPSQVPRPARGAPRARAARGAQPAAGRARRAEATSRPSPASPDVGTTLAEPPASSSPPRRAVARKPETLHPAGTAPAEPAPRSALDAPPARVRVDPQPPHAERRARPTPKRPAAAPPAVTEPADGDLSVGVQPQPSPAAPQMTRRAGAALARRSTHAEAIASATGSQPDVRVSIGRIDLRASGPPAPAPTPAEPARPALSLDDYLRDRGGVA